MNDRKALVLAGTLALTGSVAVGLLSIVFRSQLVAAQPQRYKVVVVEHHHGADLQGANLNGAKLTGASLRGANLRHAHLDVVSLQRANLRDADLQDAVLSGADLRHANLRGADLRKALLFGVVGLRLIQPGRHYAGGGDGMDRIPTKFQGADLRDADLSDAWFYGGHHDLLGCPPPILRGARYNAATRWPHGVDPQKYGAILVK